MAELLTCDANSTHPLSWARRLQITQLGGTPNLQNPERNFARAPAAVREVISHAENMRLVHADRAHDPFLEISSAHPIYSLLEASRSSWASVLVTMIDRWFDQVRPTFTLDAAVALSAAVGLPLMTTTRHEDLTVDDAGRIMLRSGMTVRVSSVVDYPAVLDWMASILRNVS